MIITLQELKSHLWKCAEVLRGSAVDRTDWKAFILPVDLGAVDGSERLLRHWKVHQAISIHSARY